MKYLNRIEATNVDKLLVNEFKYSIEQLMELAGLAVAQIVSNISNGKRILVLAGPGNNGGDGLVAARHLKWWGFEPAVYYPKRTENDLYKRLCLQLEGLKVPLVNDYTCSPYDHIIDALFGFSFKGPVRREFLDVIGMLESTRIPITSIDLPSSWEADAGKPETGAGSNFNPESLISLTAPKLCTKNYTGRHFLAGRGFTAGLDSSFSDIETHYSGNELYTELFL